MKKSDIKTIARDLKAINKLNSMIKELRKQADKIQYLDNRGIESDIVEFELHLNELRNTYSDEVISEFTDEEKKELDKYFK